MNFQWEKNFLCEVKMSHLFYRKNVHLQYIHMLQVSWIVDFYSVTFNLLKFDLDILFFQFLTLYIIIETNDLDLYFE